MKRFGLALALLVAPSMAMADCTSPAGTAGTIIYNVDHATMQFCNGTSWVSMAAGGAGSTTFSLGSASAPGFTPIGDANTGLFSPSADALALATAGSERFRIDSSGNVGIGATSPAQLLHLSKASGSTVMRVQSGTGTADFATDGTTTYITNYVSGGGVAYTATGASSYHAFTTNSSERMRIDSSGNVGIGTTSPAAKLHVASGAVLLDNTQYLMFKDSTGTADEVIGAWSDDYTKILSIANGIDFQNDAGSTLMRLSNAGYLGIGTTSPVYSLDVQSPSTSAVAFNIALPNLANNSYAQMYIGKTPGTNTTGTISFVPNATAASSTLRLGLYGSSDTLSINGSGNVGIGTTSPSSPLHVVLSGGDDDGVIRIDGATRPSLTFVNTGVQAWAQYIDTADSNKMKIGPANTGVAATTAVMTMTTGGNVGIGTTSPGYKLDVAGNFQIQNADPYLLWYESDQGTDAKRWDMMSSGGVLYLRTVNDAYTAATSVMEAHRSANTISKIVFPNGNVGIGTSSPTTKLDVIGALNIAQSGTYDVWIQGGGSGSGNARNLAMLGELSLDRLWVNYYSEYTGGVVIGGPIWLHNLTNASYNYPICTNASSAYIGYANSCAVSDIRVKQDVVKLEGALEKLLTLQGISFDWKDPERKKNDGRQIGLIAQEVDKVFPEAIIRNRTDGMLGLNYDSMVAVTVEAIKELKADNEKLRAENEAAIQELKTTHAAELEQLRSEVRELRRASGTE